MAQGRKKLTDEEKELRKQERQLELKKIEDEKNQKILEFKECDYINTLDDELILKFLETCETEYSDLKIEEVVSLMFKKFANKEFVFKKKYIYE